MGIESIGSVAGATASYQTAPVAKSVKTVEPVVESNDVTTNSNMVDAMAVTAARESDNMQGSGKDDANSQSKRQQNSLAEVAKDINKKINSNTVAEFGYHESTRRITIKIKDKDTNEIIKEIPSEKALEMLEKAWELAGILVDEKR